jgi:hypothetical protein
VAARGARVWLPRRLEEATEGAGSNVAVIILRIIFFF